MKELASGLAQLLAVIMLTITLAISVAALSLWVGADAPTGQPSVAAAAGVAAP